MTAPQLLNNRQRGSPDADVEEASDEAKDAPDTSRTVSTAATSGNDAVRSGEDADQFHTAIASRDGECQVVRTTTIKFDPSTERPKENTTLYIPGPRDRERGKDANFNSWMIYSRC